MKAADMEKAPFTRLCGPHGLRRGRYHEGEARLDVWVPWFCFGQSRRWDRGLLSFDLSGASTEVVLLAVTVAVVLGFAQGPLRLAGWVGRASRYLALAEKFADCESGRAERAAADALRKKAAELVVWRLKSSEALGDGLLTAVDRLIVTLCVSVSLSINGIIWVAAGSMSFSDACGLVVAGSLAGFVVDGIRALFGWLFARREVSKACAESRFGDDLDARVERMYRELMELPVIEGRQGCDIGGDAGRGSGDERVADEHEKHCAGV